MNCEESKTLINARVDDELDAYEMALLDEHMVSCSTCQSLYLGLVKVQGMVREAANAEQAPESLFDRVSSVTSHESSFRHKVRKLGKFSWPTFAFGSLSGLAVSLVALQMMRVSKENAFASIMVDDHVRSLLAEHLVDVKSSDQHTVKPWFLGRLDFAPTVLDLKDKGFPLIGGRLDYIGGQTVAALVYGRGKHLINVFVMPEDRGIAIHKEIRGYHLIHWKVGDLGYWAISDVNSEDLETFGTNYTLRSYR